MTESLGPHTVRASDAEREEFASKIREAVGEGRLSLDEGDQRLAKIYAARFREELPLLIRDLPQGSQGADRGPAGAGTGRAEAPGGGPGPWGRGRRGPGPQEWDAEPMAGPWRRQASEHAPWSGASSDRGAWGPWGRRPGPWRRLALLRHVGLVAVVAALLIGIWAITASHFFWPAFPLLLLTLGLIRHARWHSWASRR